MSSRLSLPPAPPASPFPPSLLHLPSAPASYYHGQWLLLQPTPSTPRSTVTVPPTAARKVRHGQGTYSHLGLTYAGDWSHDAMQGSGHLTFPSGASYRGLFRANTYEGQGVYSWPDGSRYDGEWHEGHMHGQGCLTLPSQQTWQGQFAYDSFLNESGQWQCPPVPLHL